MSILAGKRILLVEDEALLAYALEDMVLEFGCTVIGPALRLDQAIELSRSEAIDAAVLDVNINADRSYVVADILERRSIPYIFATGYGIEGVDKGRRSVPVLSKPYRTKDVQAHLHGLFVHS